MTLTSLPTVPLAPLPQEQTLRDNSLSDLGGRGRERGRARGFWHLESKKKAKKEVPSLEPRPFFAGIHGKNVWLSQDHIKTLAQRLRVT